MSYPPPFDRVGSLGKRLKRPYRLRPDRVAMGLLLFYLGILTLSTNGIPMPVIRPVAAFLLLSFAPGMLVLMAINISPRFEPRWFLYALGSSLMVLVMLGLILSVTFPLIGLTEPLSLRMLLFSISLFMIGTYGYIHFRGIAVSEMTIGVSKFEWNLNLLLGFVLLIPLSILFKYRLAIVGDELPLLLLLSGIAVIPIIVSRVDMSRSLYPVGIWSMALAVLYHGNLGPNPTFGGHVAIITSWQTQTWDPTSYALAQNAVVFPAYAQFAGVHILTELTVMNPVIVAFIPLAIFVIFEHYTSSTQAFLGASLFVFAHPFYVQYPSAGRVATPVLFLVLIGVIVSDRGISYRQARFLSVVFASGIIVSHYGTAYFVMAALASTLFIIIAVDLVDHVVQPGRGIQVKSLFDGIKRPSIRPFVTHLLSPLSRRTGILTPSFTVYFAVGTVSWYLYTQQGQKFQAVTARIISSIDSVLFGATIGGGTANRLQANYGAVSITYSKMLYLLIAALMAIGVLAVYLRRVTTNVQVPFDDEYLAIATTLLGVFSLSLFAPHSWGGGRPMMVAFSLTGIFTVVGAEVICDGVRWTMDRIPSLGQIRPRRLRIIDGGRAFAFVLAALFVLNTGIAASVAVGGFAPSNILLEDQLQESDNPHVVGGLYQTTNLQTHLWLIRHRNRELPIYGDVVTRSQVHDWYNADLRARVGSSVPLYSIPLDHGLQSLRTPGLEPGYVILLGHNTATGKSAVGRAGGQSMAGLESEFEGRNKIYTTGWSHIYFGG